MSAHAYQRPHSPCPSPSPSAASSLILRDDPPATPSPNSNVPPWIVPGPSSRFNTRERNRPVHTRHKSNYVPQGPVLSTEQRAHQRAQSYAGKGVFSLSSPTPPTSECGRSPLGRMSSYPGESDVSNSMASSTSSYNGPPVTPAKATMHRRGSSIQDSPFSDYFTDDARSLESQSTPTSETQRLLVRLNKLQSQLMRGDNAPEILHVVGRRISEIEADVEALHSHSLIPDEIDEIEEEDEEMFTERERDVLLSSRPGSRRQPQFSNPLGIEEGQGNENNWDKARQDKLLNEAQTALHFLTQAQEQLTQRHQELVNLNEEHSLDMEEKEMEVERLRSENESLKSDLGFDHSELLFLELQLKSLEVECEDSMYQPKLERLQRQMENWRDDWRDVEARFKNRRARYGVTAQGEKIDKDEVAGAEPDENDPKEWKVDIQKQGTRRVNSLTIRRVSKESESEEQERKEWLEKEQPTPTKLCAAEIDSTPKPSRHAQQEEEQAATKPQLNKTLPTTTYTSQSTQTTPPPSPTLTPVPLSEALGLNGSFNPGLDDCAITTSPSSHADSDEEDEEEDDDDDDNVEEQAKTPVRDARKEARKEQKRTALRELWSGLTDWAGMGDDNEW